MHLGPIFLRKTSLTLALLMGAIAPGCDDGGTKKDKPDAKVAAKVEPDAKAADAKAADAKAEDAKAADAKAEDAKAADAKAEDAKAEDAKAEDAKAEDAKAEDAKADPPKKDPPKKDPPKKDPPKKDPPKKDPPKKDPEPAASGANGRQIYTKKCKNCHGVKGDADTKIGKKHDIPSWKDGGWKSKWPMAKVKDIVKNGKSGTKMKAFKDKLKPEEIDAVSKYSRSLGS